MKRKIKLEVPIQKSGTIFKVQTFTKYGHNEILAISQCKIGKGNILHRTKSNCSELILTIDVVYGIYWILKVGSFGSPHMQFLREFWPLPHVLECSEGELGTHPQPSCGPDVGDNFNLGVRVVKNLKTILPHRSIVIIVMMIRSATWLSQRSSESSSGQGSCNICHHHHCRRHRHHRHHGHHRHHSHQLVC